MTRSGDWTCKLSLLSLGGGQSERAEVDGSYRVDRVLCWVLGGLSLVWPEVGPVSKFVRW
jgi:hypothetical protein